MDLVSQHRIEACRQEPAGEILRPRVREKRRRDVPSLNLTNLPLRQEHYFSVSSRGSAEGLDITQEEIKMEKGKRLKKHGATKRINESKVLHKNARENPGLPENSPKIKERN